ncbi:hypothetical protein [Halosimplex sp. J119]
MSPSMSSNANTESGILTDEDQYSGKIYWLNLPTGYTLDIENLRDHLDGRIFKKDISEQFGEDSGVFVPDVFKQDNEIVSVTNIERAELVQSNGFELLLGHISIDSSKTVTYRGEEILMLDNIEAKLLIFEFDGIFYLIIMGSRSSAESAAAVLKSEYDEIGSAINGTRIMPNDLQDIREELNAELMDTIISDYPENTFSTVEMRGEGFENEEDYKRHRRRGQLKNHMFQTQDLASDDELTIGMSRDSLVRIYSNSTISVYVRLLTNHVLPRVHLDDESYPSLTAYEESESDHQIYTEIDQD